MSEYPPPERNHGFAFLSWRDAIKDAQSQIDWAYERRRLVFQKAFASGLSLRLIGEAAGLSAAGVHKIIGKQRDGNLDAPAEGGNSQ